MSQMSLCQKGCSPSFNPSFKAYPLFVAVTLPLKIFKESNALITKFGMLHGHRCLVFGKPILVKNGQKAKS